jgi:hypothetical protein
VFTAGVGRKIQPTTAAGSLKTVHLAGPRRSVQSFQIVVRGEGGPLSGVTVSPGALDDDAGHELPASGVVVFRETFIDFSDISTQGGTLPVPENSPSGDGRIPDPLVPLVDPYTGDDAGQPFDVPDGNNQPLFVDVDIPDNATAGTYKGTLTVLDETGSVDVPVELEVWDLDLPDMTVVTTHFKFAGGELINYHDGTASCSGSNCWLAENAQAKKVMKRYEELLHSHRVDPAQKFISQPVSSGNCSAPSDWSDYDADLAPYLDGSYFADGVPSSRITVPFTPGAETSCTQAQYTAVAAAWAKHLKDKGWFDRAIVYAYDEPPTDVLPDIAKHSSWMQDGDPDWKAQIMVTKSPRPSNIDVLDPAIGIFCDPLSWYDHWSGSEQEPFGRQEWKELFAQGTKLWFYESNAQGAPYPTFATNSLDGLEPVIMMWGSWYEKATGFLLWDTAAWDKDDPWGPTIAFNKTGDGVVIYPGNHDGRAAPAGSPQDVTIDGPVASYRLKMIRAGLQDWALLVLAEQEGVGDFARKQVETVYSQFGGCTWSGCPEPAGGFFWKTDETEMQSIRLAIAGAVTGQ